MPVPIACIIADAHVDHLIWRNNINIRGDAYYGLQQASDVAMRYRVKAYFAGDNIELKPADTPTSATMGVVREEADRLRDAGLFGGIILGQHDQRGWFEALGHKNADLDGMTIDVEGRLFTFMSYRRTEQLPAAMSMIDNNADVLICHQVWFELMGGSASQARIRDIDGPSLVISGDLHQSKKVKITLADGSTRYAISPGATHARKINEPAKHNVVLVFDDLSIKHIPINSRQRINCSISTVDDFDQLYSELPKAIEAAYLHAQERSIPMAVQTPIVVLSDGSDVFQAEERVRSLIGDSAFLFYERSLEGLAADSLKFNVKASPLESNFDIPLVEYAKAEAGEHREVADLLEACFTGERSPKEAVEAWHAEFINSN